MVTKKSVSFCETNITKINMRAIGFYKIAIKFSTLTFFAGAPPRRRAQQRARK